MGVQWALPDASRRRGLETSVTPPQRELFLSKMVDVNCEQVGLCQKLDGPQHRQTVCSPHCPRMAVRKHTNTRVYRVLEKSSKVLEFWRKKIQALDAKVLEKSLNLNVPYFEIFAY